jgi:sialate O-acetylesterase
MKQTCRFSLAFVMVLVLALSGEARADIKLPPLFSSDMVIQRSTEAPIWGWGKESEEVSVTTSWGASGTATADRNGRWEVRLKTPGAGGPHTIEIKGTNTVTLRNVFSGDVWVCSGQSNMEWPLARTTGAQEEMARADFPRIRHFKMHRAFDSTAKRAYQGRWEVCSPRTAGRFTAVGYYFGKQIHLDQKIPIGLLGINWGGTRIEPWTPPAGLRSVPELKGLVDEIERMDPQTEAGNAVFKDYVARLKTWLPEAEMALAERRGLPPQPEAPHWRFGNNNQNSTFIYNGMIAPMLPFAIKGAIWYQGESNGGESREVYRAKMKALINGWRSVFDQGDFPFYYVQLANLNRSNPDNPAGGDGYARVRQAQFDTLALTNTGMAVIIDIGEAGDIHPRNKMDVGKRLARWALAKTYGERTVPSGPIYRGMKVEGNKAILSFDYVGSGLMVGKKEGMSATVEDKGAKLKWFAIEGKDRRWHWADAVIEGDTVVVSSTDVPEPVAVRYAYAMNPAGCNLYNREGLPASPFTTEQ